MALVVPLVLTLVRQGLHHLGHLAPIMTGLSQETQIGHRILGIRRDHIRDLLRPIGSKTEFLLVAPHVEGHKGAELPIMMFHHKRIKANLQGP